MITPISRTIPASGLTKVEVVHLPFYYSPIRFATHDDMESVRGVAVAGTYAYVIADRSHWLHTGQRWIPNPFAAAQVVYDGIGPPDPLTTLL